MTLEISFLDKSKRLDNENKLSLGSSGGTVLNKMLLSGYNYLKIMESISIFDAKTLRLDVFATYLTGFLPAGPVESFKLASIKLPDFDLGSDFLSFEGGEPSPTGFSALSPRSIPWVSL